MGELDGVVAVVTGVDRGYGRAVAEALVEAGARVVGVGPGACGLVPALGERFVAEPEPPEPQAREELLRRRAPHLLVITSAPGRGGDRRLDPREAFEWTAAALRVPLSRPSADALILVVSGERAGSGPDLPGALAAFVLGQSRRDGLRLRFVSVLVPPGAGPRRDLPAFLEGLGPAFTEIELGADVVRLVTLTGSGGARASDGDARSRPSGHYSYESYELTSRGLVPRPAPPG